jgi:iron complex outermembrane receptor protein
MLLLTAPATVRAADPSISITATTLDGALTSLARQTGTDIISTEPGLSRVRVRPVQGRMPVRAALEHLLAGSGYRAVAVDARSFRIVRDTRQIPMARPAPLPSLRAEASSEVVVTASKQRVPLLRYPGTLTTVAGLAGPGGTILTPDLDGIAGALPVLQSTALGAGRNKIFIRGVADSSFNGATQSTASIYFGDVQLAYSGPEPDLRLYDMQSVDVLEGPQGTLYGAGAIGGIIRLTPASVDLDRVSGAVEGGVSASAHGAPGFDLAGRLNVPVADQVFGVRAVAYRARDGGYIDDVGQRRSDVNRVDTVGGRIAARLDPGGGWQIDASALAQRIEGRDAAYGEARDTLMRFTVQPQPYHNQFLLGRVVVTKNWESGLQLVSASGISDVHSSDLFDATPFGFPHPLIYRTDDSRLLLTHETRLSRSTGRGNSWVLGVTLLRNRDIEARVSGLASNPTDIIGVTNVTQSASLFGEGTIALTHDLAATLGARVTYARVDSEPSTQPASGSFIHGRSTRRFDPTFALSWRIAPHFALFGRVQTGYRTGGVAVARGIGRVADFNPDSIIVGEVGFRRLHDGPTGVTFSGSASYAHWVEIQADLINRRGAPYTTNFGNARIFTLEGNVDYVPVTGFHATASFLFTSNTASGPLADLSLPQNRRLPETPPFAGNVALRYEWAAGANTRWNVGADGNYVGRSVLGTGDVLDISQGKYLVLGLHGGWTQRGTAVTLRVENLTNRWDNRFAYGNPFTFISRAQATPLRPITIRLGVSRTW